MRKRQLLQLGAAATCEAMLTPRLARSAPAAWRMPDEAEAHLRTWMAFGASAEIWGDKLLPEVQRNLATIANAIARHEPVSMLVRPAEMALAKSLVGPGISLLPSPLDDLWMRDTGPVFVQNPSGKRQAISFNFNGWGEKQAHALDANVAQFVASAAGVPLQRSGLVLEGGGIEVNGLGTAIVSESCVINDNRNPGVSKADCENQLKAALGLKKIIWLPGIKGKDITDGHTDFYARFASPDVVLAGFDPDPSSYDHAVTQTHLQLLKRATDAQGRALKVLVLQGPRKVRAQFESPEFAAGYIGFYVAKGAVIAQEFGDTQADQAARKTLQQAFPKHKIEQINIDVIAAGGGSIHCTTQQEIAA